MMSPSLPPRPAPATRGPQIISQVYSSGSLTHHVLKWGMSQLHLLLNLATILNYWTIFTLHWEWSPVYPSLWQDISCKVRHKTIYMSTDYCMMYIDIYNSSNRVHRSPPPQVGNHGTSHWTLKHRVIEVLLCWKAPWSSPVIPLSVWPCRSKIRSNNGIYCTKLGKCSPQLLAYPVILP